MIKTIIQQIMLKITNKTYIFIDSANLIFGAKATGKWKVDFNKLFNYLKDKYQTKKIFYYTGFKPKSSDIQKIEKLKSIGYVVKSKPLKFIKQKSVTQKNQCPKCKHDWTKITTKPPLVKANCDVDLTLDVLKYQSLFDQIVVLSGDGDFLILYQYLESIGKKVKIISESKLTAKSIRIHFGQTFTDLLSIKKQIEIK
ncbi:hypothetical protein COS53_00415 [Candidatus Shapirobacteria bacterium CG03_land_8_20_14_0_80_35_14]|uniref:NYN domain-containing protein n=5 Tax=Candidatus Shapironibacteriota TaxID=1752721 RepID=A0A2M7BQR8_9BACT|nr:MAG: hypothetical protein COS53_00415 [Candidatus Shapirobacteria bacterium CG03_land_8_20_14_0_80_35_14]